LPGLPFWGGTVCPCGNSLRHPYRQRYCSAACRNKAYRDRKRKGKAADPLPVTKAAVSDQFKKWERNQKRKAKRKGGG
jgi:hypothetical protein